jgi:hypothetical protein
MNWIDLHSHVLPETIIQAMRDQPEDVSYRSAIRLFGGEL